MKKKSEMKDELRPEYDFSKLTVVAERSRRKIPAGTAITLDPDVAEMFPTSEAINELYAFYQEPPKNLIWRCVNSVF